MRYDQMTPKQQEAVKALQRDTFKRGLKQGAKSVFMLIAMNIGNGIVNALTVQSEQFLQFMMVATFVMILAHTVNWAEQERKRIEVEVDKIEKQKDDENATH